MDGKYLEEVRDEGADRKPSAHAGRVPEEEMKKVKVMARSGQWERMAGTAKNRVDH